MLKFNFFKYFLSDNRREKGAVALLLSFIILSVIFIISVGMAIVRMVEIQLAYNVFESTAAYQAADSGIEFALNELRSDSTGDTITGVFCDDEAKVSVGDGSYCLGFTNSSCQAEEVSKVKSIGMFGKTKRAVDVSVMTDDYIVSGQSDTFNYTGAEQSVRVPTGVSQITITAYGAQGGSGWGNNGGLGGMAKATFSVSAGDILNVYIGGVGENSVVNRYANGGWNGGGGGAIEPGNYSGAGGGGASDVRIGSKKIIVAGGGGGAGGGGKNGDSGGAGGGLDGIMGGNAIWPSMGGEGGTQFGGGVGGAVVGGYYIGVPGSDGGLGSGGSGGAGYRGGGGGGGGGGGYYGGGGGGSASGFGSPPAGGASGGGGGSSYLSGTNTSTQSDVRSGDGQVIIDQSVEIVTCS